MLQIEIFLLITFKNIILDSKDEKGKKNMGKQENKITYLMILFFVLFVIFYIIIFTLLPFIYLFITIVIVFIILVVGSFVLYKKKNQLLSFVLVRFFRDFIKIACKSLVKGKKVPPPLTEYEKNGIIFELARGKCEHLDCNIQDNLELYYIIPRSEGGENSYNNLVVLCPTHYSMADMGVLSKGLLRYFINERDK